LQNAVRVELQPTADNMSFEDALVLPAHLMPSHDQYQLMAEYAMELRAYMLQTPELGDDCEERTAAAVTKLFVGLAGTQHSELSEHGRSVIYLDALDDVNCWAVEEAVRRWFRAECGEHDYRWPPGPAALRLIAQWIELEFKARITVMDRIMDARAYIDCTKQFEQGRKAWLGVMKAWSSGTLDKTLSFRDAVALAEGETK
jgi:hypothetical protein